MGDLGYEVGAIDCGQRKRDGNQEVLEGRVGVSEVMGGRCRYSLVLVWWGLL